MYPARRTAATALIAGVAACLLMMGSAGAQGTAAGCLGADVLAPITVVTPPPATPLPQTPAPTASALATAGSPEPGASPSTSPTPTPTPTPSPTPTPTIAPSGTKVIDSTGRTLDRVESVTGLQPSGIAIDTSDTWGRVYVADTASDRVTVIFGRSPSLQISCQLPVNIRPYGIAVDGATGYALVTLRGAPQLVVISGRGSQPEVVGTIDLPAVAGWVAIDQQTHRAFVSLPALGQVAVLEPGSNVPYNIVATVDSAPFSRWLAVDQASGRLIVSNEGQPESAVEDRGKGSVTVFDGRANPPVMIGEPIPASVPIGIAFDPLSGNAYIAENGTDQLLTLGFPRRDAPPTVSRIDIEPNLDEGHNINPVDLVLLPATRQLVVTQAPRIAPPGGGHVNLIRLDSQGQASWEGRIPSADHTRGIAVDPVTGRVFVSEVEEGRIAAYLLDEPSKSAPPPSVAEALPGPLEISFTPEDVARTVGLSLLVLLLVGAPTPLFNETLESNLGEIQGWFRRLLPSGGGSGAGRRVGAAVRRLATSRVGIAGYLLAAAAIFSYLTPGFPDQNGPIVFGVALLGLALATAVDIVPGERYVVRRYGSHGTIRVAVWTLGLAGVCVLISRLSGAQPGYVYGIIGTFTFTIALGVTDEGRMEARGALALLVLALVAWFARIPFEPTPGVPASGLTLAINAGLVGIFVVAVEGLVFGLVPLKFLPGQKIFAWSRWRWLLLWGAGLALFAHVLVYPVTLAQPNPDPSSLTTTLVSVGAYGAIAVAFWAYFRWRGQSVRGGGHGVLAVAGEPVPGADELPRADEVPGAG